MGTWEITAPDGKVYDVEGATQEGALAALKKHLGGAKEPPTIATTDDGGRVMQMDDGTLSFASPNYSTNDQDAIARIMQGATIQNEVQRSTDDLTIAQHPVAARAQEFNQGAPIAGEWLDEAVGTVAPKAAEAMRQTSDAMERRHPAQSMGLNVAGGVAYTAPIAVAALGGGAPITGNATTKLGQFANAAKIAAPAGAVEGAAAFSGRAEPGKRAGQAAQGALVGGTLAAAVGGLSPLLADGAVNVVKRIKGLDIRTIAAEFGISPKAATALKGYLKNDDLDAAQRVLARGGDDVMLAEAGPATRQTLDTAMATGGEALATGRDRVATRVQGQADRFATVLNDTLGTAEGGIKGASRRISQSTAKARQAAYDRAYAQPTPMTGKAAAGIEAALQRISPKVMSRAVEDANDMMRDAGMKNLNIMASIDDATGEVVFSQPLSVAQLDYIARALGDIADDATDKLTGSISRAGMQAANQAKALRDALKEGVDGYATALKLGGDNIANKNALVMGRKLLNTNTTVEEVRTAMSGASDEVKAAARKGLRENIEAVMGRARTTISDLESGNFDFDAGTNQVGEAVAALRALSTPDNFKKMRLVLGLDAKQLNDELARMGDVLVLRAAVAKNSATAIRTAGREAMQDVTQPGLTRRAIGEAGSPLDAARELTRSAAGTDARSISQEQAQYFAEIADALTRIKGPEAQRALRAVQDAMNGQPVKDADAALIGKLIGGGVSLLGYQGARQPLTRQ